MHGAETCKNLIINVHKYEYIEIKFNNHKREMKNNNKTVIVQ